MHVPPSRAAAGRRPASGAALVVFALLVPSPALAVTFRVLADGTGPFATIQDALDVAADGDVVQVGPGTWAETLALGSKVVTLRSSDGAATTILDGGGAVAAVTIGGDATLDGFTIHNDGGAGITIAGGSPTLSDLTFEDLGTVYQYGGAVSVSQGSPTITGCTFTGGTAAQGAHLYVNGGSVTVLDSDFSGGVATYGGSISLAQGELVLDGAAFHDNEATIHGGAVYTYTGTSVLATDTTFTDNVNSTGTTYGYGGGLFLGFDASLVAEHVTFSGNGSPDYATTYAYGGGLFLESSSTATLTDVTLDANVAYYGGGLFQNSAARLDVTSSSLTANYAYYGGAIWVSSGDRLSLADTRVDANTSLYSGAGMYVYYLTTLSLTGTSFTDNLAYYGYGAAGMVYYTSEVAVSDTVFDGNIAYYTGGALYLYDVDDMALDAVTATDNRATYGDGGFAYALYTPTFRVTDSTFSGNAAYYGGGAVSTAGGLAVTGSTFTDNVAELRSGGALSVDAGETEAVTLVDTRLADNTAGGDGGAAVIVDAATLAVSGVTLEDNTAGVAGGGLFVEGGGGRTVRDTHVYGNRAEHGGGLYVGGAASPDEWTNNVLQQNEATDGGGACFLSTSGTTLVNNVVVGNDASADGAALYLYDAVLDVRNVVFAYNTGAAAVFAWDAPAGLSLGYDDWYGNSGGDLAGALAATVLDRTHLTDAPGFVAWSADSDPSDDSFVLWRSSRLVDAGDPFLQDVDGSASDIGVWSGPYVPLEDADGDGTYGAWDCDDTRAEIAPGAADPWYDGVDQDCEGNSDYDQDRDGQDALPYGGADCDDLDFGVTGPCDTGAPHPEDTGTVDSEADEEPVVGGDEGPTGCGCDTSGKLPTLGAWALVGLLWRRRR